MSRDGSILKAVQNMYRKVLWVVLAVFVVACAALSVHQEEDLDDNDLGEFNPQGERQGKICKFYIMRFMYSQHQAELQWFTYSWHSSSFLL